MALGEGPERAAAADLHAEVVRVSAQRAGDAVDAAGGRDRNLS